MNKFSPFLEKTGNTASMDAFKATCRYHQGTYDTPEAFASLNEFLTEQEKEKGITKSNRIFYLALPPAVFASVSKLIKEQCWSKTGFNRVIVEKPFGTDSASSAVLSAVRISPDLCTAFLQERPPAPHICPQRLRHPQWLHGIYR